MNRAPIAPPRVLSVFRTVDDVRSWSRERRQSGHRVALVPTMGALHDGHRALLRAAGTHAEQVVVSIFVNPAQFGPGEDHARYPRTLDADLQACREEDVEAVFTPDEDGFYRADHSTWVQEDNLSAPLEGAARPGHFRGVLTAVLKLLVAVEPDVVVFGQKDAQQALLVSRMLLDMNLPAALVIEPTLRDADGLALSSRNIYLSPDERRHALALPQALEMCRRQLERGEASPSVVRQAGRVVLEAEPEVEIDYLEVVDVETLRAPARIERPVLVAAAVRVGGTRLIDNVVWPAGALAGAGAGASAGMGSS